MFVELSIMGSRSATILTLTLLMAMISLAGVPSGSSSPVQQLQKPMFSFTVLLKQMEMQEITADVQIDYLNMPSELTPNNLMVFVEQKREYGGEYNHFEMQVVDPIGHSYRGTQTIVFHPRGNTELYPLDGYALNFTFTVRLPSDLIKSTNTKVGLICLIPGLEGYKEAGTSDDKFDAVTESYSSDGFPEVQLNTSIHLQRGFSSQLVMSVLFISFLLLGSLLLIQPNKLEQRLSACLTLFMFSISFTFTIQAPTALQARATFAETLTFILLIGAGLLSVLSVVEKTLFEERPRFVSLQYPIEGAVLILLSLTLHGQISHFIDISGGYPWLHLSSTFYILSAVLITAILYGYVIKTTLFLKMRKRSPML